MIFMFDECLEDTSKEISPTIPLGVATADPSPFPLAWSCHDKQSTRVCEFAQRSTVVKDEIIKRTRDIFGYPSFALHVATL